MRRAACRRRLVAARGRRGRLARRGHRADLSVHPRTLRHVSDELEQNEATPSAKNAVRQAYRGLEGLNDAADAVEAMMATPGWAIVMELAQAQKEAIDRKLRLGHEPKTQAEYAMWHGRLDGLATVFDLAEALSQRRRDEMAKQKAKHEGEGAGSPAPVRS